MEREALKQETIIRLVHSKTMKQKEASRILGVTVRQVKRLCRLYRESGIAGLVSKRRGVQSPSRIPEAMREKVIECAQTKYVDFGPTFMSEKLLELDHIKLSKESVRKILVKGNVWKSKKEKKRSIHQRRERRACLGELVQIDGSPHAWFEGRGDKCCLIVFVDDATNKLLYLQFEAVECTAAYFRGMAFHLTTYGVPCAYYSDKHMIFRVSNAKTEDINPTQFERACASFSIEGICAHSPQAKGRVERANRTLQDRLVKEMRLQGICNMEQGNAFLKQYMSLYNKKFAVVPRKPEDVHQSYTGELETLQHILSIQSTRKLSKNLELSFNNVIYQVIYEGKGRRLQQSLVTVCEMLNGDIHLLLRGKLLAYKTIQLRTKAATLDEKSLNAYLDKNMRLKPRTKPALDNPYRRFSYSKKHTKILLV